MREGGNDVFLIYREMMSRKICRCTPSIAVATVAIPPARCEDLPTEICHSCPDHAHTSTRRARRRSTSRCDRQGSIYTCQRH